VYTFLVMSVKGKKLWASHIITEISIRLLFCHISLPCDIDFIVYSR
jgi:hypothetical protein